MPSVKEDWILWANRFQTEHITLLKRVQEVETHTSQIPQLQNQIDKLADGHRKAQQSTTALTERTLRLEEDTSECQQNTTQELTALRAKVVALEKEKEDAQMQLEQWKSQAVALLEKEYEQARQELYHWKTQIETQRQTETHAGEAPASGDKDMLNQPEPFVESGYHRLRKRELLQKAGINPFNVIDRQIEYRAFSEATTADESLLLTQNNTQTCDLHTMQTPTGQAHIQHPASQLPIRDGPSQFPREDLLSQLPNQDLPTQTLTQPLPTQGRRTLQDYLTSGSEIIPTLVQNYEAELVKSFVEKMREKHRKATLRNVLQKKGWTWEVLESEVRSMIEEGKMRKKAKGVRRAAL